MAGVTGTALAPVDNSVAIYPTAEPATVAAVPAALGQRRLVGAERTAGAVDRLDLLGAALEPATAALAVLWLAGTKRAQHRHPPRLRR